MFQVKYIHFEILRLIGTYLNGATLMNSIINCDIINWLVNVEILNLIDWELINWLIDITWYYLDTIIPVVGCKPVPIGKWHCC